MPTFNAYGSTSKGFDKTNKPIWLGTVAPHAVGGVFASAFRVKGALYAAGSPINLNAGVIKPLVAYKVVAYSAAAASETYDTVTIVPAVFGNAEVLPKADDVIQKLGDTFASTAKAAVVYSITPLTGDDAGKYNILVAKSANLGSLTAGDLLVPSASATAGNSKSMADQPNAYLYNDVYFDNLETPTGVYPSGAGAPVATGAAVDFHGEGLLVDFTPSYEVAAQMKAAVPNVIQVSFPSGAFVTVD